MWDIWTTFPETDNLITITAVHTSVTYAYYTIQHEGGHHIDFSHVYISGRTTANNCKTAFSLHVVESASDDNNF